MHSYLLVGIINNNFFYVDIINEICVHADCNIFFVINQQIRDVNLVNLTK